MKINWNYVGVAVFAMNAGWTAAMGKYVDTFCFIVYAIALLWIDRERKYVDKLYDKTLELQKQVNDDIDNFRVEMYQDK